MNIYIIFKYKMIFIIQKVKCKDNKYFKNYKKINFNIFEKKKIWYVIIYINEQKFLVKFI